MKIEISIEKGVVFRLDGDMVLLPIAEEERKQAFDALTHSLYVLAGIKQLDATGGGADQYSKAIPQSSYLRKPGVVVPLR